MKEEAWLKATDVNTLLQLTRGYDCKRKLRLFACACARCLLPKMPHLDGERFISFAEQFADNPGDPSQLLDAASDAREAHGTLVDEEVATGSAELSERAIAAAVRYTVHYRSREAAQLAYGRLLEYETWSAEPLARDTAVILLRDIFGNPFRPIDFAPWRTDTAVTLARQMYESRDFGAMPILADALQDAGCNNTDVLNHCRDANQTHVRGCWVVDGVLGKE